MKNDTAYLGLTGDRDSEGRSGFDHTMAVYSIDIVIRNINKTRKHQQEVFIFDFERRTVNVGVGVEEFCLISARESKYRY